MQVAKHKAKDVNRVPPPNWWTNRKNQPSAGRVHPKFVNYDQNDLYQLWPLAEQVYNNSATNAQWMSPFYTNSRFHLQTEWMKECKVQDPGAQLYAHWMQTTHLQANEVLERTRSNMNKSYHRKARKQPDIHISDPVMLNANQNRTKWHSKKLSPN